ncbi:hypothetical protein LTR36_005666 [Oleoguttula mirabilis]|uniref:Uncharacterized protein n=1 Tax=Oleoguttula mirabilis TaxID=1507867 RepID=A0AAV9JDR4_9PEZI|nr:hypothetical protein LTR36_005666 [Oleoguttula mirabilis]
MSAEKVPDPAIVYTITTSTNPASSLHRVLKVYLATGPDQVSQAPGKDLRISNWHGHTGPSLLPDVHERLDAAEQATVPPPVPLRYFAVRPPHFTSKLYGGDEYGTCHLLFHSCAHQQDKSESVLMAQASIQRGSLHRNWSWAEWAIRFCSAEGRADEGLIRRQKGYKPGRCGFMAKNGWAPLEVVDTARITCWRVGRGVYTPIGVLWRLVQSDEDDGEIILRCFDADDLALCQLLYRSLSSLGKEIELSHEEREACEEDGSERSNRKDAALIGTFTIYKPYLPTSEAEGTHAGNVQLPTLAQQMEKLLFQGLVLAEKVRGRRSGT